MQIEYRAVKELKAYKNNPRHNDAAVEAVAASIEQFGFKVPIIIDKDDVIITGHTRLKAAKLLHMDEVPTICADDLTEEEVNAFRLADNKVAELATWDMPALDKELNKILNIDMEEFGFELDDWTTPEEDEDGYYGDERERTFDSVNFNEYDETRTEGIFDMPTIEPVDHIPSRLIGFNYAKTSTEYEAGIHFYLDDYQFERIWNRPYDYLELLGRFNRCLTPNFSIYLDMPEAMKIWNTYRARMLGQMMQDSGITVIPIVYWSDERSYKYCFDGLPVNGTLSVNNIGNNNPEAKKLWDMGMDELIRRKSPKRILLYGNGIEENYDFGDIEVITYRNEVTERMRSSKEG